MTVLAGLVDADVATVRELARTRRDELFGRTITYSPKVFIPLTELCRDRCGYCTFAKAPAHLASPYLTLDQVVELAAKGEAAGCTEALFTLGERPELRYPDAAAWLAERGYDSTVTYLAAACAAVLEATSLLPHANAGALHPDELATLRAVSASQGMMLETLRADLEAHRLAPDKTPARRLATLEAAGELRIPFTTGLLIGIGEGRGDRLATLEAIAESHERHGHVQEVIVQNFLPKAAHRDGRVAARAARGAGLDDRGRAPRAPRRRPRPGAAQPRRRPAEHPRGGRGRPGRHLAGDPRPRQPRASLAADRHARRRSSTGTATRSCRASRVHPRHAADPSSWLDGALRTQVLRVSDSLGFGRGDAWVSGGTAAPPPRLEGRGTASGAVAEALEGLAAGQEPGEDQLVALFAARGRDALAVLDAADDLRRRRVGDEVTYVVNRNINYTNVCTFKCRFCAFSKGPLSLNLRGDPYLLDLAEVTRRVAEAEALGCTEVCLQGGIHPSFDGDYYLDVLRAVREGSPSIHIHAFSALEVFEGARRSGTSLAEYLTQLKEAGLKTLPGTAAEILDDEVRARAVPRQGLDGAVARGP